MPFDLTDWLPILAKYQNQLAFFGRGLKERYYRAKVHAHADCKSFFLMKVYFLIIYSH